MAGHREDFSIKKFIHACASQGFGNFFKNFYAQHKQCTTEKIICVFKSAETPRTRRKVALSSLSQNWHVAKQSDKLPVLQTLAKMCEAGELDVRILALRTLARICREDAYMRQQVLYYMRRARTHKPATS